MLSTTSHCLNCNHEINGHYCANCGQKFSENENLRLSHFLQTAVNEVFSWDSKLWTTLKLLVLRPGLLTEDYLNGRRVAHIHPVRMFIVISAMMMLINSGTVLQSNFHLTNFESAINEAKKVAVKNNQKGEGTNETDITIGKSAKKGLKILDLEKYLVNARTFLADRYIVFDEHLASNFRILSPFGAIFFAFVLFIFFRKKKLYYVQHLTFSMHYFCFSFLLSIISGLLVKLLSATNMQSLNVLIVAVQIAVFTIYFHKASQRVYEAPRKASIVKTMFALLIIFLVNLSILLTSVFIAVSQMPVR